MSKVLLNGQNLLSVTKVICRQSLIEIYCFIFERSDLNHSLVRPHNIVVASYVQGFKRISIFDIRISIFSVFSVEEKIPGEKETGKSKYFSR